MELKNKFNTTKGEDEIGIYEKLESKIKENSKLTHAYYARIYDIQSMNEEWSGKRKLKVPVRNKETDILETHKVFNNPKIKKISGDKLYEILTGDPFAFKKLIYAVPRALTNLGLNRTFDINGDIEKYIIEKNFSLSDYQGFEDSPYEAEENLHKFL